MTYGLIVIVLGIWGSIFYQLFDWTKRPDIPALTEIQQPLINKDTVTEEIKLLLNYRDPFLERKNRVVVSKSTLPLKKIKIKVEKNKKVVNWPHIIYNGSISNKTANKALALLKINGRELLMKEAEMREGVEVWRIYSDSISLAYMKLSKMIYK